MIFTANQVLRSQESSQEFNAYGAENLGPAVISTTRIMAIPTDPISLTRRQRLIEHFNRYVALSAGSLDVGTIDKPFLTDDAAIKNHRFADKLFSIPDCVAIISSGSETVHSKAEAAGYRKVTQGRRTFYQGPSVDESMKKIAMLGGEIYSFAPNEKVSIGGAFAAFLIRRLLFYGFHVTKQNLDKVSPGGEEIMHELPQDLTAGVAFSAGTNVMGHFLPYWDGLVIPDKGIIIDFIRLFSRNLGKTTEARRNTTTILLRGWSSLGFTSVGKKISHMIYCIGLAVEGGFRTRPVYTNREYVGMLILGRGEIIQGSKTHSPVPASTLAEEIASISGHDTSLKSIADIVSSAPLRKTMEYKTVYADSWTTPRRIHKDLSIRKFTTEQEVSITKLLKKLHFSQKFFELTDDAHLLQVIVAMKGKSGLDDDAPCDYMGNHMFTSKKILSALLAYGPLAPSPQVSANSNITVRVTEKLPTTSQNHGTVGGIPLFVKPIQEAYEEWTAAKKSGAIAFHSKGKDRNGRMKIRGLSRMVEVKGDLSKQVLKAYVKALKPKGKREREEDEEIDPRTVEANETARRKKRVRLTTDAENLFGALGMGGESQDVEMESADS